MERSKWLQKKLVEPERLFKAVEELRSQKLTIATLNGSFDLLHAGHLYIISEASKLADRLFLLLNTDRSVQGYKGPKRPIVPLAYRLEMVAALEFVDYVSWFDEADPRKILEMIKPDFHANGSEYGASCIEADVVRAHGGKLILIDRIDGLSTSQIVEKIRQCEV